MRSFDSSLWKRFLPSNCDAQLLRAVLLLLLAAYISCFQGCITSLPDSLMQSVRRATFVLNVQHRLYLSTELTTFSKGIIRFVVFSQAVVCYQNSSQKLEQKHQSQQDLLGLLPHTTTTFAEFETVAEAGSLPVASFVLSLRGAPGNNQCSQSQI